MVGLPATRTEVRLRETMLAQFRATFAIATRAQTPQGYAMRPVCWPLPASKLQDESARSTPDAVLLIETRNLSAKLSNGPRVYSRVEIRIIELFDGFLQAGSCAPRNSRGSRPSATWRSQNRASLGRCVHCRVFSSSSLTRGSPRGAETLLKRSRKFIAAS